MNLRWSHPRTALLALPFALGFGVLEGMQGRVRYGDVPWGQFWPEALLRTLPSWTMLALLMPAIGWVAERVPVGRGRNLRAILLHAAVGVMFVFVHIGASAVLSAWVRHSVEHTVAGAFRSMFYGYAVMGFFTYAGIVAALHAIRYQAEAHASEQRERERAASLTRAQLQALRSQLDPHFLFNALNAISALALTGDRERVVRAVSSLGEVLRMALGEGAAQEVPLSAELALLERYLELERLRFGDRLQVEQRIAAGTTGALVPSLVLQPLVENALRHGLAARRGPFRLEIVAERHADRLELEVADSGPGFGPGLEPGVGLVNTRERVRHLYGEQQQFVLGRSQAGGASVRVVLPYRAAAAGAPA